MATVSQEHQSSPKVRIMPVIVFGVLSLIFGIVMGIIAPNLGMLPEAASVEAQNTDTLFRVLIFIGSVVFFLVQGLVYYAAWAFRAPANDDSDGPNLHGNFMLEVVWTIIPAVVVVFIAIYAFDIWQRNTTSTIPANLVAGDSIRINSIGQRFGWSFEYLTNARADVANPDGTISEGTGDPIVLNTSILYVYVGQNVELDLETRDVIHSFWSPEMRVKQDLLPGRITTLRFTPIQPNDASNPAWDGVMVVGNFNLYASPDATTEPLVPAAVLEEGELPAPVAFDLDNSATPAEGYLAVKTEDGETAYIFLSETQATGRFNRYRLICAELCGGGHADMWNYIYMFESAEAYESAWYQPMVDIASVPAGSPIELGEQVINSYGCSGCHMLSSLGWAVGVTGPNLDGIGSRAGSRTIDATGQSGNEVLNGAEYLVQSLRNPHSYLVPPYGPVMRVFGSGENAPSGVPASLYMPMPQEDLIGIVAFLCTQTGANPASSTCGLENWEFDDAGNFTGDAQALYDEISLIAGEYE